MAQYQPQQFKKRFKDIGGYQIKHVIGGGGFSKVYLAINPVTESVAACKVIDLSTPPPQPPSRHAVPPPAVPNRKELEKEVKVHRMMKHANVLEFMDARLVEDGEEGGRWVGGLFVLLELAAGGDLFDKIAPDQGIEDDLAHFYFWQLLNGLEFIHSKGVAHRDIKPENLLLSSTGDLKISDFGLCSVFKLNGKERTLTGRCGSLPYIAPELNEPGSYRAEPVDIWGAGVVLFTLLCGNTPWDEPTTHSPEFAAYLTGELWTIEPWSRLKGDARDVMRKVLEVNPQRRITLPELWRHPWVHQRPSQLMSRAELARRLMQNLEAQGEMEISQPSVPISVALSHVRSTSTKDSMDEDDYDDSDLPSMSHPPLPSQSQQSQIPSTLPGQFTQTVGMMSQTNPQTGLRTLQPILTRCYSLHPPSLILPLLFQILSSLPRSKPILTRLRADEAPPLPVGRGDLREEDRGGKIKFALEDARKQLLDGALLVSPVVGEMGGAGGEATIGSFVSMRRTKGDPLEWRKLWYSIRDHEAMQPYVYRPTSAGAGPSSQQHQSSSSSSYPYTSTGSQPPGRYGARS